jgi:hypothetical protein
MAARGPAERFRLTPEERLVLTALQYRMVQRDVAADQRNRRIEDKRRVRDEFREQALASVLDEMSRVDRFIADSSGTLEENWAVSFIDSIRSLDADERYNVLEVSGPGLAARIDTRTRALLLLIDLCGFQPWTGGGWVASTRRESLVEACRAFSSLRPEDLDAVETAYRDAIRSARASSRSWAKILVLGGAGLGLGALTGGLAAPAIGLAALSGASVAVGGMEIAGGTLLIAGTGAAVGAGAGALGADLYGRATAQIVADAIRLAVIKKLILRDDQGDDEAARLVVECLHERVDELQVKSVRLVDQIKELRQKLQDAEALNHRLKRQAAAKDAHIARLRRRPRRSGPDPTAHSLRTVIKSAEAEHEAVQLAISVLTGNSQPHRGGSAKAGESPASAGPQSIAGNLDAEQRRLDQIEALLALDESDVTDDKVSALRALPTGLGYDKMTAVNERRRVDGDWGEPDLYALLTDAQRERLTAWRARERVPWVPSDYLVVGLAATTGVLACLFDTEVDAWVKGRLAGLKDTEVLRGWEAAASGLPIDYTGSGFGGPAHRVRSAGHDLGRPLAALAQIREGVFRGVRWTDGQKVPVWIGQNPFGRPYNPVASYGEAMILWAKHLAADFVTPMSLPLPGWTWLYELPVREVRKFAHDAYSGVELGAGMNLRSGLVTPALSVMAVEAIVTAHVHADAYRRTGSWALSPALGAKRTEMLLAAQGVVGAVSLGKAACEAMTTGPFALRHLNTPLLLRVGSLALTVRRNSRKRDEMRPQSWQDLLESSLQLSALPDVIALEQVCSHDEQVDDPITGDAIHHEDQRLTDQQGYGSDRRVGGLDDAA